MQPLSTTSVASLPNHIYVYKIYLHWSRQLRGNRLDRFVWWELRITRPWSLRGLRLPYKPFVSWVSWSLNSYPHWGSQWTQLTWFIYLGETYRIIWWGWWRLPYRMGYWGGLGMLMSGIPWTSTTPTAMLTMLGWGRTYWAPKLDAYEDNSFWCVARCGSSLFPMDLVHLSRYK